MEWNWQSSWKDGFRNFQKSNSNICCAVHFSTQLWHRLQPTVPPLRFQQLTDGSKGKSGCGCMRVYVPVYACMRMCRFLCITYPKGEKKKCALILTSVCVCLYLTSGPCDIATPSLWYCTILSRCHNRVKMPHLECRQNLEMNPTELGRETENVSGLKSSEH